MRIRRVSGDERLTTSFPLQSYAFDKSPTEQAVSAHYREFLPYHSGNHTLVAEEDGVTLAAASAIPMQQNVRGMVLPMAGVAGVATHPLARRRGFVRALLNQLLEEMRDEGNPVSALYPFRPSFYARFGYVSLPQHRSATFSPDGLGDLLRADLPGELRWRRIADGYADLRALTLRLLDERHGFAVFPDFRAVSLRDDRKWVVTAHVDGEVAGALSYRIDDHLGELSADTLLHTGPRGRALLLQFLARHADQVDRVKLGLLPGETPELWADDIRVATTADTRSAGSNAPMARVLSLDGLEGIAAGPVAITVDVVDDALLGGRYHLDGTSGTLAVDRSDAPAAVSLTAAGLSALVYGVLDPAEITLRGLGTVPVEAAEALRVLFPPRPPYVFAEF
ncbi:GNAT family N-acetyltransferase [Asanoa sp. WMMD1127]|uniref:GNAT family N-acetyltransferase n=1 Tax=Asanoa sp. WMMD1127 TaxID=3016107 RepID=UPI0024180DD6|nr:GNAT family N-acetyltransferase [Asanoa sp. WMMD1127]MDG4822844.1 GNAT family N-acetyltransferase [Asanoa sp. WMMD1127]